MNSISCTAPFHIKLDGKPLSLEDARSLGEVRVHQRLSQPTLCELRFFEPEGPLGRGNDLPSGAMLSVTAGDTVNPLIFNGQVTSVEHRYEPSRGHVVSLRGYDLLYHSRRRQTVRAHVQVTLADLMKELLGDLGITVESQVNGPVWQRIIQHQQTDFELIAEMAERAGLYFTLREGVLHVLTLEGMGEEIPLSLGRSLFEAQIEVNTDKVWRSVAVSGWDPWHVEPHEAIAEKAGAGCHIAADAALFHMGERFCLVNDVLQDDHHAEACAQAELDSCMAREATFWGVADGDPRLRPGTPVRISGVNPALEGRYVLTAVNHSFDHRKGFISELATSPPPRGGQPRGAFLTYGIVTRLDDPENLGRVCVALPTYNHVETDWMGILAAGAGAGKGLVMLPDVDDQVLVIFSQGNPAQGVVLGGLYGLQRPADWGLEMGRVQRYIFHTAGRQKIYLDDAHNLLRFENNQGSHVELSPERILLHAERANIEIEAPGEKVVIRGKSIDFERA